MTDAQLCAATLAGDTGAFGALVSRYQDVAFAVACGATGDPGLAEDLAQEAFVVAWRRLATLVDRDRFAPWLCGIVRNVAREARRHARRHAPRGTEAGLFDVAEPGPSPFESAAVRESLAAGLAALGALAPRYREPLLLFVRLDRSHARVAACLGLTVEAVRQRLSRARRQLRDEIDRAERVAATVRLRRSMAAPVIAAILLSRAATATAAPVIAPHALPFLAKAAAAVAAVCAAVIVASGVVAWRQQTSQADAAPVAERQPAREAAVAGHVDPAAPPIGVVASGHQARSAIPASEPAARRPRHPRGRVRHGPAKVKRGRPSVGMESLQHLIP